MAPTPSHERPRIAAVLAVATAGILLRSFVFVWYEQAYFDADQAVTGLMGKHLAEGRAFPLFFYGQHYMLAVEAWLAAPIFAAAGVSVLTLKLPLVALNVAAAWCLLGVLLSDDPSTSLRARLWPAAAALSFFVFAPPIAASRLVEAQGGNIEPFVYIPLLWLTRRRPVLFGAIAAIGILNRQFTLYGLVALAVIAVLDSRFRPRPRHVAIAAIVFLAIGAAVEMLSVKADVLGPSTGTDGETMRAGAVGAVTRRVGWHPSELPANVSWLVRENLPALFGAPHAPQSEFIETTTAAAPSVVWWLLAAVFALISVRLIVLTRRGAVFPRPALFLILVGVQAAVAYAVLGVDVRAHVLVRYSLLALLLPIGLVAAGLALEPDRRAVRAVVAAVALWTAMSIVQHAQLVHEYVTRRPANPYRQLVEYLRERGIKYADADYWTAYTVTFLSNEELIVKSREKIRVEEYQRIVDEHDAEAVQIWREPGFCARETHIGSWYICGL